MSKWIGSVSPSDLAKKRIRPRSTSTLTGDLNAGKQVVAELKKNKQIGWTFMNESDALESVESERCYAAIIIPSDFSGCYYDCESESGTN